MTTDPPSRDVPEDDVPHRSYLADGLSTERAEQARRIFAALRRTRQARHRESDPGTVQHLCPVVLADGCPCLLPLPSRRAS